MYAFCILSSIGYGDDTGGGGVAEEAAAAAVVISLQLLVVGYIFSIFIKGEGS
jgi:hypothetical protein